MGFGQRAMEGMVIHAEFWRGKRVLVTGHTGFKGSWLSLWLQELGASVTGYALAPSTSPNLFNVARVEDRMASIIADVRDFDRLLSAVAEQRPEIVFHMAAQALVRRSYDQPVDTYATNVMGTVNLLEVVRRIGGVRAVLNVTSDKCYENRERALGYREDEPMGGYDPYSSSKGCAELVTAAYRSSFFNPADYSRHGVAVASARAGNVIGGGDWAKDRLIPDILTAFLECRPAIIRNPDAIRPWQHVLEPLGGYLTLAERLWYEGADFAEAWNFGPSDDDARSVSWIADQLALIWGSGAKWNTDQSSHPHEAHYLRLDCSKAQARLGWTPRWNLRMALEEIVDWYQAFQREEDIKALTLRQISQYTHASRESKTLRVAKAT